MAHKPTTFAVDTKKKTITIYTNVEAVEAEQTLINYYLGMGYAPKVGEKKESKSVKDMRAELEAFPEVLAKFDDEYAKKTPVEKDKDGKAIKTDFKKTGFAAACKVYNDWKKDQKKNK